MKRESKIEKWARLALEKNGDSRLMGIAFVDACFCGSRLHRWGERPDNIRCPARRTKRQEQRVREMMEAGNAS